jgi:hypothetical protein
MTSNTQHLTLPFNCRSSNGCIHIDLQPNQDSDTAWGYDLIFPSVPRADFARQYFGFPVMKAEIEYPIPSNPSSGYGSLFGWIQFVTTNKGGSESETEIDLYPAFEKDSNNPFAMWGYKPTLFDAPSRLLKDGGKAEGLVWSAQSFLCYLEDAGMTRRVKICPGGGFGWGFDVEVNDSGSSQSANARKIVIKEATALDVAKEWNECVGMLRNLYPNWAFREYEG